jgi:NitT/TauT family transport system ATP-binding protein
VTVRMGEGTRRRSGERGPTVVPRAPEGVGRTSTAASASLPSYAPRDGPEGRELDERQGTDATGQRSAGAPAIELRGVTRGFPLGGSRLLALHGLDLAVAEREVVAVVGPNGSGKSTMLRVIAGLLSPDEGMVAVSGRTVDGPTARVGLVFQEPRLLPWRDTLANVAFPLELDGVARGERERRAREALDLVDLRGFEAAHPVQLSGGMAQRAALARALVSRPAVLLLDEPFSALDALTRERLDLELQALWTRTAMTFLIVTHSIPEAVLLADRVVVLSARPGRVVADVRVDVARPRRLADADQGAFAAAAQAVRGALEAGGAAEPTKVAA